jgi:putative transposase
MSRSMPRKPRFAAGGLAYHVMNRTWVNTELFEDAGDYEAFERLLAEALDRFTGIRLCAYCLMPNHFHLVPRPSGDGQLSRFMTHVQRCHAHRHSEGRGHVYQSRVKRFAIEPDGNFLSVCSYVERNSLVSGGCSNGDLAAR